MLQACPQIHRQRADLQFHRHQLLFVHKIYRHPDDHVKTPVTVLLRRLYVILDLHNHNIILRHQTVADQIDVLDIRADNTDSRDVVDVVAGSRQRQIQILLLELAQNTLRRLQAGVNMVDRTAQLPVLELVLYYLKPCRRRTHRRIVHAQDRIDRL